ncbi:MAG: TonB-dependent receptor [Acidobacteriota bacterium]
MGAPLENLGTSLRAYFVVLISSLIFGVTPLGAADVSGSARDETGRRLAGVLVELLNLDTGVAQRARTDDQGRYAIFSLPPGRYALTASMTGFQKETYPTISVAVGQQLAFEFTLRVGSVSDEVTVTGEGRAVDLTTPELSSLIDERQIQEMPLNGRDWITLSELSSGVIHARRVGNQSSTNMPTGRISVGGQRPAATNFTFDGVDMNVYSTIRSPGGVSDGSALGLESVKEFRIVTTNFSAEHGTKSGGLIQVVSKSGTNRFRGSAYWYHRNDAFDARDFFDPGGESDFRRNQYGLSLGGPLVRNRMFFFLNYEGLRERKAETSSGVTPTADARQGVIPSADGNGFESIDVNPNVRPFLDLYPLPNGQDFGNGTGLWSGKAQREIEEDYWALRIDHSFTDRDRFFARYGLDDGWAVLPFAASDFPGFPRSPRGKEHLASIGYTRYQSPTLLNDLNLGFSRSDRGADLLSPNPNGLSFTLVPGASFGSLRVGGLGTLGNTTRPVSDLVQNVYQLSDAATFVQGRHSLKFGVEFRRFHINNVQEINTNGAMTFSSLRTFLEGTAASYRGVSPPALFGQGLRFSQFAVYLQDKLSVVPSLTLNLGLRYEPWSNVSDVNGKLSVIPNPLSATGADDFQVSEKLFVRNPSLRNWGPRLGLAWDVLGRGTASLRAGIGIFHDCPYNGGLFGPVLAAPPFVDSIVINDPGFPDVLERAGGDVRTTLSPTLIEYSGQQWPSILQYHVSFQRQLPWSSLLSLAWVGARGSHLQSRRELNSRVPTILEDGRKFFSVDAPRKNPAFSSMILLAMDARSWYDSLQVSWRRRYARGFSLAAFYTLGKAIDEAAPSNTTLEVSGGPMIRMDSDNLALDKGLGVFDVRHNFSASFLWDFPLGHGRGAWWGALMRDWQVGGLITLSSGHPFTPLISFNNSRSGVSGASAQADRPNLNQGYSSNPLVGTVDQWYDPWAFALPQAGFFGDVGRNTVTGPGFRNLDLLLSRSLRLGSGSEKPHVQLRAEFFNVLNHPNFDLPGTSLSAEASSYIFTDPTGEPNPAATRLTRTAGNAREVQFGIKLLW